MKVDLSLNQPKINKSVKFEGYKPVKSEYGDNEYEFNYVYDDDKYDCYLEIFSVDKDSNGNYFIDKQKKYDPLNSKPADTGEKGIKLESGKATKIDMKGEFGISSDEAFAYHYKLYPKGTYKDPKWAVDAGNIINETYKDPWEIYNIVTDRASTVSKGGAMKLIDVDINNVMWVYDNNNNIVKNPNINHLRRTSKNFANKIGGSLAGLEKDVESGKLDNFTRIITLPLFTDDCLTAHAYWNKNCMQMAHSLGNINNYSSLQKKLFAKGINLVSDGAYVNEGLEGIHFSHVLKWGTKSPYLNWFKIADLESSPLSLGVFGKNQKFVTHKLINSKYAYSQQNDGSVKITKNRLYDSKAPTYILIYDRRIDNAEKMTREQLLEAYNKLNKKHIEFNTHNDTVIPYQFEINSDTYLKNVENLNKYNKKAPFEEQIKLYSPQGTRMVSHFEHFTLDSKHESGFETWDANPDIAKLNYVYSNSDAQKLKNILDPKKRAQAANILRQNNMQVQDYAISSAKFWTKKTNDILNLYVAQNLKDIKGKNPKEITDKIKSLSNGKVLPKDTDVNQDIVTNVLNGSYFLHGTESNDSYDDLILRGLMDLPLDSVEVGDNISAVLASPYITKRAIKDDQLGVSRFEMYKNGNKHLLPEYSYAYNLADKMYTNEMKNLADEILKTLETRMEKSDGNKLRDKNGNPTDYAKYIIPLLTAEIARFAIIKSVLPDTRFSFNHNTGEITYKYKDLKNTSLQSMGIISVSPEDEAVSLIHKLRHRIKRIDESAKNDFTNALWKSIEGTDANSFKLAEMIVDRTQAGLDWRIDATKDIGDIGSLRNQKTDFELTWNSIINFWSKFTDGVKKYHPDAYIAAEVTDEGEIFERGYGSKSGSRFADKKEAVKKLINEAGFTTLANYGYFSSDITQIFGKLFDFDGENSPEKGCEHGKTIYEKLVGSDNFINSGPLESLIYSYTFAGNHDKSRALEGFAMDMDMVYADLTNKSKYDYRQRAYKILEAKGYGDIVNPDAVNEYDFDRVSTLAIAKCESIASGMGKASNQIGVTQERSSYIYGKMLRALAHLAKGKFKDRVFEADGFGAKDYNTAVDLVLEEMDHLERDRSKRLTADEKKKLKDKTLERIIDPAMSRLLGQTKFLVALLGNPTLFAGDEYGSTGYETTTKNIYLQNRNIIHEEWADPKSPDYKEFVKRFKDYIDYQYHLRTRKELQPLNDGAPFVLKPQDAKINTEGGKHTELTALLRQSPDGRMTVSVFNTSGLNHKFDEYYTPGEVELNYIDLNSAGNNIGLPGGLKPGLMFKNADPNDKTIYYVNGNNQITGPDHKPIKFQDSTLILYYDPSFKKEDLSFTGRRIMYNPQYNFNFTNAYKPKSEVVTGSKLALISK